MNLTEAIESLNRLQNLDENSTVKLNIKVDMVIVRSAAYVKQEVSKKLAKQKYYLELVCDEFGVTEQDLLISTRGKIEVSDARCVYSWLLYKHGGLSYPSIGRMLNRDHSTIMHQVKVAFANQYDTNTAFSEKVDNIIQNIKI